MNWQSNRSNGFLNLPVVTKWILGINIVLYLAKAFFAPPGLLDKYLDLYYFKSDYFKPYQVITHMFMHADFYHLLFNMFGVYTFGAVLEKLWGPKRFLNFYFLCGIGSALAQWGSFYYDDQKLGGLFSLYGENIQLLYDNMRCLGASGALFGLLGAFGLLFPNTELYMMFIPIPIKAKYFVIFYAAIELFSGIGQFEGDNVAHFAHLGGLAVGLILVLIWRKNRTNFY